MRWTSRITRLLALVGILALAAGPAMADDGDIVVELGNKTCPIMKKAVTGHNFAEWNGLRIGTCCGGCVRKILADPQKTLDAAGIEWREAADLVAKARAAKGAEREKLLAEIAAKYTLVSGASEAAPAPETAPATSTAKELVVDLGNAKCPVSGEAVDGETFTVWNGVRIGECCPGCTGKIVADPEAVLAKAGIEWQAAAKFAANLANATPEKQKALLAASGDTYKVVEVEAGPVVDLGNPKCPIMGGDVDGKTYTVWNGLRIGHCCPGCTGRLLANPEKVLDKAGIEWRDAAKAVAAARNATGEKRAELMKALAKKYDVVGAGK